MDNGAGDGVEKMTSATWNVDLFGDGSLGEDR